jgi:hypothetical protein
MLKKIWPNGVKSDAGYSIKRTDRFKMEYVEHEKTMIIEVEDGLKNTVVYQSTIKNWLPPNDDVPITPEDKQRIVKNIDEALKFLKWDFVIE